MCGVWATRSLGHKGQSCPFFTDGDTWWGLLSPSSHQPMALLCPYPCPCLYLREESWQFPGDSSIIKEMGSITFQQNSGWLLWIPILCASSDLLNAMLEKFATFQPHFLSLGTLIGQGTWQSQSPGLQQRPNVSQRTTLLSYHCTLQKLEARSDCVQGTTPSFHWR